MNLTFAVLYGLTALSLSLSVLNFFTVRRISTSMAEISESVTILIPMRNEESNVDGVLSAALASTGLEEFKVLALDDSSTDQTSRLLSRHKDEITIVRGKELATGWLGKPFACHQLSQASVADYLVFIDADVRLSPTAISSAIATMKAHQWDFLSPYPKQLGQTFLMKLIQPLLQWSWLTSVPLRFAERGLVNSMIVANGQFFIVRRDAYEAIKGHQSVKTEVLEDLSLARNLNAQGYSGAVADASSVVTCSMYETNRQLIDGYTKSLWKAFGAPVGAVFTVALLLLTQVAPIALFFGGYTEALFPFLAVAITHLLASRRTHSSSLNIVAHPLAALALIALICESWRRKSRGQLVWRGRRVS
jgi:cellulose synthase/poly-beta-1,6-N-acetylglucosamine synthase-like glycosyltransferase